MASRRGLLLALCACSASSFVAHKPLARPSIAKTLARRGGAVVERAGAGVAMSASLTGVLSSRWGVPALTGVATTVLVPLTMVRQGYVFSVGYGSAVAAIGATLLAAHRPAPFTAPWWLAAGLVTYGARLAAHLLVREEVASTCHQAGGPCLAGSSKVCLAGRMLRSASGGRLRDDARSLRRAGRVALTSGWLVATFPRLLGRRDRRCCGRRRRRSLLGGRSRRRRRRHQCRMQSSVVQANQGGAVCIYLRKIGNSQTRKSKRVKNRK